MELIIGPNKDHVYACDSAALIYLERYNNDWGPVHIFSKQTNKQDETTPKKEN